MSIIHNPLQEIYSIPPGITRIKSKLVTCNSRYLAYASFLTVYIYNLDNFHTTRIFLSKSEFINTIKFANNSINFLAISLENFVVIYDIDSNSIVNIVSTQTELPLLTWSICDDLIVLMAYGSKKLYHFQTNISNSEPKLSKNANSMFYFNETQSSIDPNMESSEMHTDFPLQKMSKTSFFYYFDSRKFSSVNKIITTSFPLSRAVLISAVAIKQRSIFLIGSDQGELVRVNFNDLAFAIYNGQKELGYITGIDFDPLNPSNCITVWSNGTILFFDISSDKSIIEINRTDYSKNTNFKTLSGVCFLPNSPGQFLTGSLSIGTLQLWNIASKEPIENITVGNSGIKTIEYVNNNIVISFLEGSISVIDAHSRIKKWENEAAHTNTIFSAQFMPNNPNVFVTCSADGSICSWDVSTMKQIDRFISENLLFLSLTITFGGGYLIVGASKDTLLVFNVNTLKICYSTNLFDNPNGRIISIANSPLQPNLILINDDQGNCCLFNLQSQKVVWTPPIVHSEQIKCSAMSMHRKDTFAITYTQGILRLFISQKSYVLKYAKPIDLHYAIFSPHNERHLLTSTDTGIVIFWEINYENPTEFTTKLVSQHLQKSRAIAFHPLYSNIAISGGYDGYLYLFDYIQNTKICTVHAHLDHIYSACFSTVNPYLLITVSRDLTIKKWSMDKLFAPNIVNHFIFRPLEGSMELENMINRLQKDGKFSFKENSLFHINDCIRITTKRISKMLSASPHETSLIKKAIKTKQRMIKAAQLALMIGNNKQYCELLFAAGEYDKAVAAAPSVSYQFWHNMMKERMKLFEDQNDQVNSYILLRDFDAVELLLKNDSSFKSYTDAMLITASHQNQPKALKIVKSDKKEVNTNKTFEFIDLEFRDNGKLFEYSVASKEAKHFLKQGKVFKACISFLSVGDIKSAISLLQNNGEFVTSAYIARKFNLLNERMAIRLMQLSSEHIWHELPINLRVFVFPLLSFENQNKFKSEFESIYTMRTKTSMTAYESMFDMLIESCLAESHSADQVVSFGLQYLIDHAIKHKVFDFSEIKDILLVFELIQPALMDQPQIALLNIIEFYLASIESFWKGFNSTSLYLIEISQIILKSYDFSSMLSSDDLQKLISLFSNLEKMISGENSYEITINPEGSDLIERTLLPVDKNISMPFKELLKFQNVTSFSPLSTFKRIYVI